MKSLFWTSILLGAASAFPAGLTSRQSNETAPAASTSNVRIRLNPAKVRDTGDTDYTTWTVAEGASSKLTTNNTGLSFTLSTATGKLNGDWNKAVYSRIIASLGERVVGEGISTVADNGEIAGGIAIKLSISGLPAGKHSILAWHNAWDALKTVASLTVKVNGVEASTNVRQTIRVDSIWESASSYVTFTAAQDEAVEITYTPDAAGDGRAFLNGFEIDSPSLENQISFPTPVHRDERVVPTVNSTDISASWTAAKADGATYNVYLGTSSTALKSVATGLKEPKMTLNDVNTQATYYWRVDVISGNATYAGRVFTFRAAQLAFPDAEGYGRFARGGRGGKVIHVTTLEDNSEEGTLRHALTVATGPRTIVFDVGGVITTKSRISVSGQYVTLAGQTAPGKGVVVQGFPLGLTGATDVIFRHIRVRPGVISNQTIDGMGMQGSNHAIFDRCSMGWTIDESFSSRSASNITFQRNMISEPLNVAGHKNYPAGTAHGYAASIGGEVGSFHHNLIAHAEGRSWSMAGGLDSNGVFSGKLDLRNNVVYNFGGRVTDGGTHQGQFVSNLYKQGPSSKLTYALRANYEDDMPGSQSYYCAGNAMPGVFDADSEQYVADGTGKKDKVACWADVTIKNVTYQKFVDRPFFDSFVDTQSATEAYKRVLSDSGVSQPVQDDHDKRIINETLSGTATYTGSVGGKKGIIDNPKDVGGLEDFPTVKRSASWDADSDGIADWWDGSSGGEGYDVIEGYLNFMADPHAVVAPSSSIQIDLAELAKGFVRPTFTVEGATLGSVEVQGAIATYSSKEAGVDRLTVSIEDEEGSRWSRRFGVAVFEGADDV